MPIFVDVTPKPYEDQDDDTSLPDIAKEIYKTVNADGDSPLTAYRKEKDEQADLEEAIAASLEDSKKPAENAASEKTAEK